MEDNGSVFLQVWFMCVSNALVLGTEHMKRSDD